MQNITINKEVSAKLEKYKTLIRVSLIVCDINTEEFSVERSNLFELPTLIHKI